MVATKDTLDEISLETEFKLLQATLLHRRDPTLHSPSVSNLEPFHKTQMLKNSMHSYQSATSNGRLSASNLNFDNVTQEPNRTNVENSTTGSSSFDQNDTDGIPEETTIARNEFVHASRSNMVREEGGRQTSASLENGGNRWKVHPNGIGSRRRRRLLGSTGTITSHSRTTSSNSSSSSSESHRQLNGIRGHRRQPPSPRTPFIKGPRRVLVVGLEGSGASLLAQVLCQLPQSVCILRLLPGAQRYFQFEAASIG